MVAYKTSMHEIFLFKKIKNKMMRRRKSNGKFWNVLKVIDHSRVF